jgi:hypothetical protein
MHRAGCRGSAEIGTEGHVGRPLRVGQHRAEESPGQHSPRGPQAVCCPVMVARAWQFVARAFCWREVLTVMLFFAHPFILVTRHRFWVCETRL